MEPNQTPQTPLDPSQVPAPVAPEQPAQPYTQPDALGQLITPTEPGPTLQPFNQNIAPSAPAPEAASTVSGMPYTPPAYTPNQAFNPTGQTAPPQWQPQAGPQQYVQYGEQGPVVMGMIGNNGSPGFTTPPQPKSKKKLFILSGTTVAILLLVSGAVFGLYLPNTPSNVFNTGINRSGTAINSIVTTSTTPQKLATYKTSDISGNITANFGGGTYAGDFATKFDQTSLDGGLNFTIKDTSSGSSSAAKTLSAKVLSQIAKGNALPDIYFQLNGLKELGLDSTIPGISAYDGQWILVGSDYLKSIGASYLSSDSTSKSQITSSDIAEVARAASTVTTNYIFSTNKNTAVLTEKKFDGKEKVDGINTYHYTVGIDLNHAKAYCSALTSSLLSTNAYKKVSNATASQISDDKKTSAKSCSDSVNSSFKSSDTLDMWVDAKYKLIHKIRTYYDTTNKSSYFEIGQVYTGGDNLSLFANQHDASGNFDTNLTLDTDMKTNAIKGSVTLKSTSKDDPTNLKINLSSKSLTAPVTITKPTTAVPFQDVLTKLGLGSLGSSNSSAALTGGGSGTPSAADAKREIDLDNIQTQLEAYFQTSGSYPSLSQLNSTSWRATNMASLDPTALQDPAGKTQTLTTVATTTQYGYTPSNCDSANENCAAYSLSAVKSDGTVFSLQNLD
jgi:hypothetical protein